MTAFIPEQTSGAKDGQIVGFSPAAGKNDFRGFGAEKKGRPFAGIVEQGSRLASHVMNRGRIAPDAVQKRKHRFPHGRVKRRGGVIIKVNRTRHGTSFEDWRGHDETKSSQNR